MQRLNLKAIDPNRWNFLLGVTKQASFKCIPETGLGAIFDGERLVAVHITDRAEDGMVLYHTGINPSDGVPSVSACIQRTCAISDEVSFEAPGRGVGDPSGARLGPLILFNSPPSYIRWRASVDVLACQCFNGAFLPCIR